MVAYKNGKEWATEVVKTAGDATYLELSADRKLIDADGKDLAFITVRVADSNGIPVPRADHSISFEILGPGEIVSTDNGYRTSFVPFTSHEREAFNGLALLAIRSKSEDVGTIKVTAKSPGLKKAQIVVDSR